MFGKPSDAQAKLITAFERSTRNVINRHSKGGSREKLKVLRRALGLTQKDFAERFGLPYATVRNWEQETRGEPSETAALLIDLIIEDPDVVQALVAKVKDSKAAVIST
jgi:putative transcriptional regulator